ncbi:NAD(P)H-hydrate dehydratase [candidate division KSB1 bacterium]|nr:NAD(P)H-hydrate dehydratase [candidate division KSB1 bacterium]
MNAVVTAQEMAAIDRHAMSQLKIPGALLMENAGRGVAEIAQRMLKLPAGKIVHIYCGPGNNGGDGYVVARHLLNHAAIVSTFILTTPDKIAGEALMNLKILHNMGHKPHFGTLPNVHEHPDLVIDAMLGTGVKGALRGLYAKAVEKINDQKAPVLAIDIPTGVNADTGEIDGPAIKASVTATMALPKRGLLFSPGREHVGELHIVDICMPLSVLKDEHPRVFYVDEDFIHNLLPVRSPASFKNKVGMIQVIAGSKGYTGAAALASQAVLRTGAGLCYLTIPQSLNAIMENHSAEVITQPLDDQMMGCLLSTNFDALEKCMQNRDAVVLGPGIGQAEGTIELVHRFLSSINLPLVLDADALNACVGHDTVLRRYRGDLIITPHPGELARLTGRSTLEIVTNPVDIARQYAKEWQCTLVLKGGPTVTALADGRVYINPTGNAGMATAGAGDVLSGMIAALIGQGINAEGAAIAAVYLHGLAGDLAAAQNSIGLIAGDILRKIPKALLKLEEHY